MAKVIRPESDLFEDSHDSSVSEEAVETVKMDSASDPFGDEPEESAPKAMTSEQLLDLFDKEIDQDVIAEARASLFLETGLYKWVASQVSMDIRFDAENQAHTDLYPDKGRAMITLSGMVVNPEKERRGRFMFKFSPDVRRINGDIDQMTKNYLSISSAYFKKYQENATTPKQVLQYAASGNYTMYITRGKNGGNFLQNVNPL